MDRNLVVGPADSGASRVQVRQSGASWWIDIGESECGCGTVGWSPTLTELRRLNAAIKTDEDRHQTHEDHNQTDEDLTEL
jgi:uncharacterized protein (DUF2461 family)